ncbi:putative ABC transporter ATP-binding protein YxlF [compost metagenome]
MSEVLEIVGLSEKSKARLGTLSLGEGQRLGLAAALLGDPQYLVLDEPTNGLDPTGIRWFRTFIRQQSDMGKTILLSSHLLSEVEAVADDVVIINHGKIIETGELRHVMKNLESLEDVFFSLTEEGGA